MAGHITAFLENKYSKNSGRSWSASMPFFMPYGR